MAFDEAGQADNYDRRRNLPAFLWYSGEQSSLRKILFSI
jgi:hypothetical protein